MNKHLAALLAFTMIATSAAPAFADNTRPLPPQEQERHHKPQPKKVEVHKTKKVEVKKVPAHMAWHRKGGHLPKGYGVIVKDPRRYGLGVPRHGHRWVREGNDYLLVAISTGVILSIVSAR
ncbi:putative integral membrane protein [Hartmannibacter diazotrophicus]|uniref:Putative integral membrane protein n=1 Tax=Hartmannibacter diazotrophicus TaxID=1482074 RepID=A0A2C9D1D5_9HYPH|nr:RcnB family protein [Hartmannibacter diazotrophicus]SON54122.1 putative integral membrane protein [Hartmannibacter diazotrophicus]